MGSRFVVGVAALVAMMGVMVRPATGQHLFVSEVNFNRIPASGTSGPAGAYPTKITVTGVRRPIASVRVIIPRLEHTYPDDLDIVLLSPLGFAVVLMSDAGGSTDFNGMITFAAGAPAAPDDAPLIPGSTYAPTNYDSNDSLPLPSLIYTTLPGLSGRDPNGDWFLYVYDDGTNDTGEMGSVVLSITEAVSGPVTIDSDLEKAVTMLPDVLDTFLAIRASGLDGPVHDLSVRLYGLTHTFPADLDMTLTGPDGQAFVLMSDVGGSTPVTDLQLHIAATGPPMPLTNLTSGYYRATDNEDGSADLDGILGTGAAEGRVANGFWVLRIRDDASGDTGSIRGWSVTFNPLCAGDFNRSGSTTVQDVFDYLVAYFATCP